MLSFGGKLLSAVKEAGNVVKDQLASPWEIKVIFAGEHETVDGRDTDGAARPCSLFDSKDPVKGTVQIAIKADRIIEHNGVQVELLGFIEQIENPEFAYLERSEFLHLSRDVAPAGRLTEGSHAWEFDFGAVEKDKETYHGTYVSLRYVVRVTIARGFVGDARHEEELVVQTLSPGVPEGADNPPIQMEVGVQDCLHISFMYQSSHYPIGAVLTGCIGFAVVRLNLTCMESSIIRVETTEPREPGLPRLVHHELVGKTEVMDGVPGRAERVPLRWPLAGLRVTPTYAYAGKFSVRHLLKLVLVDERGRQFFKQCEIVFHRTKLGREPPGWSADPGVNRTWQDHNVRQPGRRGLPAMPAGLW